MSWSFNLSYTGLPELTGKHLDAFHDYLDDYDLSIGTTTKGKVYVVDISVFIKTPHAYISSFQVATRLVIEALDAAFHDDDFPEDWKLIRVEANRVED